MDKDAIMRGASTPEDEYEEEIRLERNRETQGSFFDDWLSDNLESLKDNFIEEHQGEFDAFCKDDYENYLSLSRISGDFER
jgi:hypothetical protein